MMNQVHAGVLVLAVLAIGCGVPSPNTTTGGGGSGGGTGGATSSTSSGTSGAGTGGLGMGGAGAGGGPACVTALDCAPTGNECSSPVCLFGECKLAFAPLGSSVSMQVSGDCKALVCDGAGSIIELTDDSDLSDDANPCTIDSCFGGAPMFTPEAAGAPCGANLMCDGAGSCVGCLDDADCGAATECATHPCQAGTCATTFTPLGGGNFGQIVGDCKKIVCNGMGSTTLIADDTDIQNDNNVCTADLCSVGVPSHPVLSGASCGQGLVCLGASCVQGCFINGSYYPAGALNPANICQTCAPLSATNAWSNVQDGAICDAGTCVSGAQCSAGACVGQALPDGSACNDGNPCTSGDACLAGVCAGAPYSCPGSTSCSMSACDGNGGCTTVNAPLGSSCADAHPIPGVNKPGVCDATGVCTYGCFDGVKIWPPAPVVLGPGICKYCNPEVSTILYNGSCHNISNPMGTCNQGICYFVDPASCNNQCADCFFEPCDVNATCFGVAKMGNNGPLLCDDDNNPCTLDQCSFSKCYHLPAPNGTACGPGMTCTAGMCQ